jgi:hypothetical protein
MQTLPSRLIDEPIEVVFLEQPIYEKRPDCPQSFIWRGEAYQIIEVISERQDFQRRGRSSRNMAPEHLQSASKLGSWGVGRYIFCVRVNSGQIFEIYFDRAPQNAGDRKGHWFLMGERVEKPDNDNKVQ